MIVVVHAREVIIVHPEVFLGVHMHVVTLQYTVLKEVEYQ
jgi:hypothetical protein